MVPGSALVKNPTNRTVGSFGSTFITEENAAKQSEDGFYETVNGPQNRLMNTTPP